jgi:hypothetical protein
MIYPQGQHITLKVDNESGHIEIKPTLLDYFKCIGLVFVIFNLVYFVIQLAA